MLCSVYVQLDVSALLSGSHLDPAIDTAVRCSWAMSRGDEEYPTAYLLGGTEPVVKRPLQIFKD